MAMALENATATEKPSAVNGDAETLGNQAKRHLGATEGGGPHAETGAASGEIASERAAGGPADRLIATLPVAGRP